MIHMPQMFRSREVSISDCAQVNIDASERDRFGLAKGDLLFARRSLNLEGAGLSCIVGVLEQPTTFESSIIRVRLDHTKILPIFAVEFLRSESGFKMRLPFIRQVAVSGVSARDVGDFQVPRPPVHEQQSILGLLEPIDKSIETYIQRAKKERLLRDGLARELLTGRVRVPDSIASKAA